MAYIRICEICDLGLATLIILQFVGLCSFKLEPDFSLRTSIIFMLFYCSIKTLKTSTKIKFNFSMPVPCNDIIICYPKKPHTIKKNNPSQKLFVAILARIVKMT